MNTAFALLARAAIPALLLSACSGPASGNGPAQTGLVPGSRVTFARVHRDDNSPADIHAGGADFPGYGLNLAQQPVGYALLSTGLSNSGQATPGQGSLLYYAAQQNGDGNNYYYCISSSGYGRKEFDGAQDVGSKACAALGETSTGFGGRGDPVDFVSSDIPFLSSECCASTTPYATHYASSYGQPFEFPSFGGPVVFPYINCTTCGASGGAAGLTGLGSNQLKLSTWTYCAISNGTIGYWDDGAITADNGGTKVAGHEPITFFYRGDTSGVTYIFESKLNDSVHGCNQTFKGKYAKSPYGSAGRSAAWTGGVTSPSALLWTGPTGTQASGSTFTAATGDPGIIADIQGLGASGGFPYGTGYAEGSWVAPASAPAVDQAALQNGNGVFVSPTNAAAVAASLARATPATVKPGEGADGSPLSSTTPWCQLYIPVSAYLNPPTGDYPIVGLNFFLFYGQNQVRNGVSHYTDLKNLIAYVDSTYWNQTAPTLEYSPIPASTQKKIQAVLKGSKKQAACFNK